MLSCSAHVQQHDPARMHKIKGNHESLHGSTNDLCNVFVSLFSSNSNQMKGKRNSSGPLQRISCRQSFCHVASCHDLLYTVGTPRGVSGTIPLFSLSLSLSVFVYMYIYIYICIYIFKSFSSGPRGARRGVGGVPAKKSKKIHKKNAKVVREPPGTTGGNQEPSRTPKTLKIYISKITKNQNFKNRPKSPQNHFRMGIEALQNIVKKYLYRYPLVYTYIYIYIYTYTYMCVCARMLYYLPQWRFKPHHRQWQLYMVLTRAAAFMEAEKSNDPKKTRSNNPRPPRRTINNGEQPWRQQNDRSFHIFTIIAKKKMFQGCMWCMIQRHKRTELGSPAIVGSLNFNVDHLCTHHSKRIVDGPQITSTRLWSGMPKAKHFHWWFEQELVCSE